MDQSPHVALRKAPWNKGKLLGQKVPLKLNLRSVASMTRLTGYPSFVDAAHGRWAPPLLT
jgi:hypothetical protein